MKLVTTHLTQLHVGDVVLSPEFSYGFQAALGNSLIRVDGKTIHFPVALPLTDVTVDFGRFDPSRGNAPFVIEEIGTHAGCVILKATRMRVNLDTIDQLMQNDGSALQYDPNGERIEIPENRIPQVYKVGNTSRRGVSIDWYDFLPQGE